MPAATLKGRCPYRVSFSGGGTDLPIFADTHGGAVLSTTIPNYVTATLIPRQTKQVSVESRDLGLTADYDLSSPILDQASQLKLVDAVMTRLDPQKGFYLFIESEAPVGSGLGASGALAVLISKLVSEYSEDYLTRYELAELAYQVNRDLQGDKVGRQDEYAAAFGGLNYMEFHGQRVDVMQLRLRAQFIAQLESRLLLCHIPVTRLPDDPINQQVDRCRDGDSDTIEAMKELRDTATQMRDSLCQEDFGCFAALLGIAADLKSRCNPAADRREITAIVDDLKESGAMACRLLGAGSGGHLIVACSDGRRRDVLTKMKQLDCEPIPFRLEWEGAYVWRS